MSRWRNRVLVSIDLSRLHSTEEELLQAKRALNTERAYRSSWRAFEQWARCAGLAAHPAETSTVRLFVLWCIEQQAYRLSTIQLHLAAIRAIHLDAGACSPVDAGIWRLVQTAARKLRQQAQKKAALTPDLVREMSQALSSGGRPIHVRDRAILLVGFAAGWRRSELASLNLSDVEFTEKGFVLTLGASKTDQDGQRGRSTGIAYGQHPYTCPVQALRDWLAIRGTDDGPLFLSRRLRRLASEAINLSIKRALHLARIDGDRYSAHSLRSGMITTAAHNGASLPSIMERSGHSCLQTLMGYMRRARPFESDPLKGVL